MNILGNSVSKRILIYLLKNQDKTNFEFKITKEIKCTYSSCSKNINLLKKIDLINFEPDGRMKVIKLTDKGRFIAEKLNEIDKLL